MPPPLLLAAVVGTGVGCLGGMTGAIGFARVLHGNLSTAAEHMAKSTDKAVDEAIAHALIALYLSKRRLHHCGSGCVSAAVAGAGCGVMAAATIPADPAMTSSAVGVPCGVAMGASAAMMDELLCDDFAELMDNVESSERETLRGRVVQYLVAIGETGDAESVHKEDLATFWLRVEAVHGNLARQLVADTAAVVKKNMEEITPDNITRYRRVLELLHLSVPYSRRHEVTNTDLNIDVVEHHSWVYSHLREMRAFGDTPVRLDRRTKPLKGDWLVPASPSGKGVILYLHGGAYVMCSPRTHRRLTYRLCVESGMTVCVPDYSLAPESPWPACVVDVLACYRHLCTSQPGDPIVVAGDSAGGALAAATALGAAMLDLPSPKAVVLLSPFLDLDMAPSVEDAELEPMLPVSRIAE
eukprot:Sspe_Gene.83156::Locus_54546_Transcript_1_1_Confidence_1.000_Length_1301::g.83156::m.83156/K14731/mlhB, chnC; epsilon-lactone hydrolase